MVCELFCNDGSRRASLVLLAKNHDYLIQVMQRLLFEKRGIGFRRNLVNKAWHSLNRPVRASVSSGTLERNLFLANSAN